MSEIDVDKCEFITKYYDCRICNGKSLRIHCKDNTNCYYKQLQQLKQENEELKQKLEKIKRLCINKEEARLLYGCKEFDFYKIIKIIESEN